jgi:hypothetical protein
LILLVGMSLMLCCFVPCTTKEMASTTMGSCPSQISTLDFPGQSSKCWESTKHRRHQNRSPAMACRLVYKTRSYLYDACFRALFSITKSWRQATMLLFAPLESLYKFSFLQLRVYHRLHYSRLYN